MKPIHLMRTMDAPLAHVFAVAADIPNCASIIAGINHVDILSEGPVGEGTRWRETRTMFGREAIEEMWISKFDPPHSYEVSCNSCGSHVLTRYEFTPLDDDARTQVDLKMSFESATHFAKLMSPLSSLFMGSMIKLMEQDMDDLKAAVEADHPAPLESRL